MGQPPKGWPLRLSLETTLIMKPKKLLETEAEGRKRLLQMSGHSQAEIARRLGISRSAVNSVIQGKQRSKRVELAVAEAIDMPHDVLFPPFTRLTGRTNGRK